MALSLLQQHPSFSDLQSIFDPIQQQQQRSISMTIPLDPLNYINADQMEYNVTCNNNNNNNSSHHQSVIGNNTNSNNHNNNNNNNGGHISGSGTEDSNNFISGLIHQHLDTSNRSYISGYHHHHISNDYEQVINFVDSPPNSEESWTGKLSNMKKDANAYENHGSAIRFEPLNPLDEHSKGSPGPQIIEVQTICSNSGSRKRRMDWEALDIGQSGNTISAQNGEVANKIPHLRGNLTDGQNSSQQQEKEKQKKEKLSGRGSWTDDIDFDLNAEFSNNSYLNNETFLSFSPALTVLKQEPQSEQLKENISPTVCVSKIDKAIEDTPINSNPKQKQKNDLNETVCGCSSPQSSQSGLEQNSRVEKVSTNVTGNDKHAGVNADKTKSRQSSPAIQQAENGPATPLSDDHKFQYILAAATSIATKNNEETLTYLNQGQSYEIKLKKTGDLSFYRDKILKSVIKICFHERRLQYMEREQMQQWQASRPGERIIEVDVPLSYGLCHVSQPLSSNFLSTVEVFWDPLKEVGVYIKVNCISTEFTPKKHGGEKGVPFRLQIETYIENTNSSNVTASAASSPLSSTGATTSGIPGNLTPSSGNVNNLGTNNQAVHAAACQIKVFKLKGADRKHKQDREKIQKRPQSEQDKFQPSYECTIMNDIPLDLIIPSSGCFSPEYMKVWPNSPVHIPKYDGILPYTSTSPASNSSPIAINSVTSSNSPTLKLMDTNMVSPQQVPSDMDDYVMNIMPDGTPAQVTQWLTYHRLTSYITTFAHFSGADILRMSKDDLTQICGLADGIRMFNILRAKVIAPRLTIYVSMDGSSYNAIYLISNTAKELMQKLYKVPGFYEFIANNGNSRSMENGALFNSWGMHSKYSGSGSNIFNDVAKTSVYITGPSGVHVAVTDEVLNNEIKDGSLYALELQSGKVIMKLIIKNDN